MLSFQAHNQSNHMNDALTSMYINNKNKNAGQNDGELIDISSDESGDEGKKANNGTAPPTPSKFLVKFFFFFKIN